MRYAIPIFAVCTVVGCDRGPQMGTVAGTVTFGGQPVTEGTIQFYPVKSGPLAAGRIGSDGSFVLSSETAGDGARVGEYVVVIVPPSDVNRLQSELKAGQPWSATFNNIPEAVRTQQSSNLTATVEAGENNFEFDLKGLSGAG